MPDKVSENAFIYTYSVFPFLQISKQKDVFVQSTDRRGIQNENFAEYFVVFPQAHLVSDCWIGQSVPSRHFEQNMWECPSAQMSYT